jgi:hypothetical protein
MCCRERSPQSTVGRGGPHIRQPLSVMVPTRTEAIARPGILGFVASHSNEEVAQLVRTGQLDRGMPRFDFNDEEMRALQTYLRGLTQGRCCRRRAVAGAAAAVCRDSSRTRLMLQLEDGRTLSGTLTNESQFSATCSPLTANSTCWRAMAAHTASALSRRNEAGPAMTATLPATAIALGNRSTPTMSRSWRPHGSSRLPMRRTWKSRRS